MNSARQAHSYDFPLRFLRSRDESKLLLRLGTCCACFGLPDDLSLNEECNAKGFFRPSKAEACRVKMSCNQSSFFL